MLVLPGECSLSKCTNVLQTLCCDCTPSHYNHHKMAARQLATIGTPKQQQQSHATVPLAHSATTSCHYPKPLPQASHWAELNVAVDILLLLLLTAASRQVPAPQPREMACHAVCHASYASSRLLNLACHQEAKLQTELWSTINRWSPLAGVNDQHTLVVVISLPQLTSRLC